jgi:hypothetical protein
MYESSSTIEQCCDGANSLLYVISMSGNIDERRYIERVEAE